VNPISIFFLLVVQYLLGCISKFLLKFKNYMKKILLIKFFGQNKKINATFNRLTTCSFFQKKNSLFSKTKNCI